MRLPGNIRTPYWQPFRLLHSSWRTRGGSRGSLREHKGVRWNFGDLAAHNTLLKAFVRGCAVMVPHLTCQLPPEYCGEPQEVPITWCHVPNTCQYASTCYRYRFRLISTYTYIRIYSFIFHFYIIRICVSMYTHVYTCVYTYTSLCMYICTYLFNSFRQT